jgi:septum formation protein
MAERLILASASSARARLLRDAGIDFTIAAGTLDETPIKQRCRSEGIGASDCALRLARAKARAVATGQHDALVIGADQILDIAGDWFDKPVDRLAARAQLCRLRGQTHVLATAVAVVRAGDCLWQATSLPRLTMRVFTEAFLDAYLAAEGDAVLASVGAYRLEGPGVQLFSEITGDHFAIQGLPLLELLDFLRRRGIIAG